MFNNLIQLYNKGLIENKSYSSLTIQEIKSKSL